MNFSITINGEGAELSKALRILKESMDGHALESGSVTTNVSPQASATQKEDKPARKDKKKEGQMEDSVGNTEGGSEDSGSTEDTGTDNVPTVVELRAMASEKGKTPEAKKAIKALLDSYGSKSISDVAENQRVGFLKELESLG